MLRPHICDGGGGAVVTELSPTRFIRRSAPTCKIPPFYQTNCKFDGSINDVCEPCISTTFPEVHKGGLVSNAPVDHVARIELVRLFLIAHRVELPESI
jgi:hypothetical protein